ncbi:MAG: sigma-70 family RNA polymerase sigma factor [Gemmataceae bacterium]|nr:sigma-70 family RNA polymerase sigma factor [Gemmata sp.]MDW8197727.1 sigma-70 family RNA polymerase sigma factor [Gemmataceae bacterium]
MNRLHSRPLLPLREAIGSPLDSSPDRELLERFAHYGDQAAFEAILRRHGPMVWGLCRRMLTSADRDDAFQATFLVLIRKASALQRADRLGPWLYGVAYRVALKAQAQAAQRAVSLSENAAMIPTRTTPAESLDWLPILDAELAALPAKYREALIVCELQGLSRREAARQLGVREGTLSSRLARGRSLLRQRLLKHGTLLPAGGLTALLTTSGISRATVPLTLLTQTAELAQVVAGVSTGVVPAGVARLTDEVLKMMLLAKVRTIAGIVLAFVATTFGLVAAHPGTESPPPSAAGSSLPPSPPSRPTTAQLPSNTPPARTHNDLEALQGWWVLEKIHQTQAVDAKISAQLNGLTGHKMFYINGHLWWHIATHGAWGHTIRPQIATLHTDKNPKWIDLKTWSPGRDEELTPDRTIYSYEADDRFAIVVPLDHSIRPAEFNPQDRETPLLSLEMRRVRQYPPSAGVPELVGSWEQPVHEFRRLTDRTPRVTFRGGQAMLARVEIYDGLIFIGNLPGLTDHSDWIGGTYTVDTTRKPAGIDITLFHPLAEGVSKLYGSYEITRNGLKLVIGLTGKRAARPMDFLAPAQDTTDHKQISFELSRVTRRAGEQAETAPPPATK